MHQTSTILMLKLQPVLNYARKNPVFHANLVHNMPIRLGLFFHKLCDKNFNSKLNVLFSVAWKGQEV